MKRFAATLLMTAMLVTFACSLAYSAPGDIWLAGYLLLTLKTPAESAAFQQRVDAVQLRANDLLELSDKVPQIEVRKCRGAVGIYAGKRIFLTVTSADARACGQTVDKLARCWAQRLRAILPEATPIKH